MKGKQNQDLPQKIQITLQQLARYLLATFSDCLLPEIKQFLDIKIDSKHAYLEPLIIDPSNLNFSKQAFENQKLFYISSGTAEIQRPFQQINHLRQEKTSYHRQQECKEGNFFSIINFKEVHKKQPSFFKFVAKTKCLVGIIPIKKQYGYEWIRNQCIKTTILSKIFYFNDESQEGQKKKPRFKQFCKHFKHEKYRREARLIGEGLNNEKLFIIAKGDVRIIKNVHYQKNHLQIHKNIDVLATGVGSVFGGQYFLNNSKHIKTILSNYAQLKPKKKSKEIKATNSEKSQSQDDEINDEVSKQLKANQITQLKNHFKFYMPQDGISNYTVLADSANVEVFYIQIDKLLGLLIERWKNSLVRLLDQFYILLLRHTEQKCNLMIKHEETLNQKSKLDINLMASKLNMRTHDKDNPQEKQAQSIFVRSSEISHFGNKLYQSLKQGKVAQVKEEQIQKRISLIMKEKQSKLNYKAKIEELLKQKMIQCNLLKSKTPELTQKSRVLLKNENKHKMAEDLEEIFMKNKSNRSQDIVRHAEILEKKERMLLERYHGQQLKLVVNQDNEHSKFNKIFRVTLAKKGVIMDESQYRSQLNYLKGIDMDRYVGKVKKEFVNKISKTNKIKEQFMKIRSQCQSCGCYDNLEGATSSAFSHYRSQSDFHKTAAHTMKIGTNWRGKSHQVGQQPQESLETIYNKMKFLSQKSSQKYSHKQHLRTKHKNRERIQRKMSAPLL